MASPLALPVALGVAAAGTASLFLSLSLRGSSTGGRLLRNLHHAATLVWIALTSLLSPPPFSLALPGVLLGVPLLSLLGRRSRRRRRQRVVRRDSPTLLDALVLAVECGHALVPAFRHAGTVLPADSPLREAIRGMEQEVALGRSQLEALEKLQSAVDQPLLDPPLAALRQALQLGTPISRALREHARMMRETLLLEGEEYANSLSVRLLFPLITFIFPASFLVILSPVLVSLLSLVSG